MEHENIPLGAFASAAIISTASWLAALTAQEQSGVSENHRYIRLNLFLRLVVPVFSAGGKPIQSPRCDRGGDPAMAAS